MSDTSEREPFATLTQKQGAIAVLIGIASGLLVVLAPYVVGRMFTGLEPLPTPLSAAAGLSLTVAFPVVQGFAMALAMGPRRFEAATTSVLSLILVASEILIGGVVLREGIVCLIIVAPLLLALVMFGALLGRLLVRGLPRTAVVQASLLPLVLLGVFGEATGPAPNYATSVTDSVVVNAPPEYVWRYVVQYPANNAPSEYWLWNVGLPRPVQSVAEAPRLGATRLCKFDGGIAFEERITELEPNRVMTFEVTSQPNHPEVIGHFQFDRGQVRLTANADGTTTITATSWYRLFVRPAAYFDLWTADITRNVHFRVLNHVKGLAERDYATERARSGA